VKADKMSMANALELRVPFLDHKLVEWAAQLPRAYKVGSFLHGYQSKRILRIFANQRLPSEIIRRPKQGFPVPAYRWMQNGLASWAEEKLNAPQLDIYFNRTELNNFIKDRGQHPWEWAHKMWALVIFAHWVMKWQK
jgi:asparagine synthase (glutamine-hydrolysing)